jgi:DNA-3-methyladenine glycosylase II
LTRASQLEATRELCALDPDLAAVVDRFGPPPLWARRPGFATLVRIVLEQQVSLASARAVFERLEGATGGVTPEAMARLGARRLRTLGFTRQKADYCANLGALVASGRLDLTAVARAPLDQGRRMLLDVRGLGPWSVDIYFLMALRRPDVWPSGDLALVEAMRRVKRLPGRPGTEAAAQVASAWTPWRSVAARVLWHYYLSAPRDV